MNRSIRSYYIEGQGWGGGRFKEGDSTTASVFKDNRDTTIKGNWAEVTS